MEETTKGMPTSRLYKWAAIPLVAVALAVPAYLWFVASEDSSVNAQIAVERACQKIQQLSSYDATVYYNLSTTEIRPDAPNRTHSTLKYQVNGDDWHAEQWEKGIVTSENKRVDGVDYYKDHVYGDHWHLVQGSGSFSDPFPFLVDQELCVNFTDFAYLGEDQPWAWPPLVLDHYSAGSALIGPTGRVSEEAIEPGGFAQTEELYQFWVDGDGQLLRMKKNRTYVRVTSEGVQEVTKAQYTMSFSGFGEPNVITAPATTTQQ